MLELSIYWISLSSNFLCDIGSEGSLGIVTKVAILTPPKLSSVNLAFLACKDYTSCLVRLRKLTWQLCKKLLAVISFFDNLSEPTLISHAVARNMSTVYNLIVITSWHSGYWLHYLLKLETIVINLFSAIYRNSCLMPKESLVKFFLHLNFWTSMLWIW